MEEAKNKNILFLINNLKYGGAQRNFVNQLNYLDQSGFNVFVVQVKKTRSNENILNDLKIDSRRTTIIDFSSVFDFKKYLSLFKFIEKNNISVLYSTLDLANVIARVTAMRKPGLSVFIRESNTADIKNLKHKIFDVLFNFFVKKIIVNSEEVKTSLLKYQSFYKDKVIVIENSVVLPGDHEPGGKRGGSDGVTILNVGSLTKQKNQISLLRICHELKERDGVDIKLTIIGEGGERKNLEEYIAKYGMQKFTTLTGFLGREEVARYYSSADIFALTSLWEGSPNVIFEAMAFGLPIVSFKVEGTSRIIEDNKTGVLIEVGNEEKLKEGILKLARDKTLRISFGNQAYKKIKADYTIDKQVDKLIKVFYT